MSVLRSAYYKTLCNDVKKRYDDKLNSIGDIDPFTFTPSDLDFNLMLLPDISTMDLVNYLILTHSHYTGQQLKARKSLQAYKFYEAGFVHEVRAKKIDPESYVVVGKVKHSQKMNEKPLNTWVIVLNDGAISSGHCTCMAGLGEVCSHIAALLFFLEARPSDTTYSCTDVLSKWPVPSTKKVEMMEVKDMGWAKTGKSLKAPPVNVNPLTEEEIDSLLRDILNIGVTPAVTLIRDPFASEFASSRLEDDLNFEGLSHIYNEDALSKPYEEIISITENIEIKISQSQIDLVEKYTRNQAENNLWFTHRAGRITASKCGQICKASNVKPPLSLIKGICYPGKFQFFSKQTNYGLKNEKNALKEYFNVLKGQHTDFSVKHVGFIICKTHPQFGASPDGLVKCDCCGQGCVEIKCPYILKDCCSLEEYANKKNSCLMISDNSMRLKRDHIYYYQVQLQMFVTNLIYCDFVVWSKKHIFIERVSFDEQFCDLIIQKCLEFFELVIKPELYSKYFTNRQAIGVVEAACICKNPGESQPLLKCDNDACSIGWYHFGCVGVFDVPSESWLCPQCK